MKKQLDGPDGVEAWCVALSACFINFVMAGLGRMSGILYVAFIEVFHVDRLQASVPFSARALARNLLGPMVGILGQKYGVRTTTLLGGLIGTLGAISCFYANNILWMTVCWGALNGAGASLSMTLPNVVLGLHFKKYRTTASGLAFSGGCVGAFLFPVLLEFLLHTYGMAGTFLIVAGFTMNVIPAAMVLRKPSWMKKECKMNIEVSTVLKESEMSELERKTISSHCDRRLSRDSSKYNDFKNSANCEVPPNNSRNSSLRRPRVKSRIDTHFLRQNNERVMHLFTVHFDSKWNRTDKLCLCLYAENLSKEFERIYCLVDKILLPKNGTQPTTPIKSRTPPEVFKNFHSSYHKAHCGETVAESEVVLQEDVLNAGDLGRESVMMLIQRLVAEDRNGILKSFQKSEQEEVLKIIKEFQQIYALLEGNKKYELTPNFEKKNNTENKSGELKKQTENANTFAAHIKTALRLHTNPIFLLISLSRCVHFITYVPATTIIVDFAMDKGLLEEDGKFVIAAMSFGDLVGRITLGWVTDKEYLQLPRYMLIVMVLQGVCTASLTFMYSRATLLSLLAVFGMLQGSLFIRHPVLVSKYLGKNEQSVAMGSFNFFAGLLGFAFPNYIGYFRDTVGSYDCIFYINGAIGCIVGIMWFFEPFFVKRMKSNEVHNGPV